MPLRNLRRRVSPATALWLAVAGCAALAMTDLSVSIASPDYDPTRETTSQLMNESARYDALVRFALAAYALLLVPMALQISIVVRARQPWAVLLQAGIWLHIVFCQIAAAFQNDSARMVAWGLTENDIHDGAAAALFAAAILVLASAAFSTGNPFTTRSNAFSAFLSLIMFAAGLSFVLELSPDLNGIVERGGMVAFMIWVTAMAVAYGRRSLWPA